MVRILISTEKQMIFPAVNGINQLTIVSEIYLSQQDDIHSRCASDLAGNGINANSVKKTRDADRNNLSFLASYLQVFLLYSLLAFLLTVLRSIYSLYCFNLSNKVISDF